MIQVKNIYKSFDQSDVLKKLILHLIEEKQILLSDKVVPVKQYY